MTRAKSKKATPDICPEISNKISTRGALFVVKATRQNVLEAFLLFSNYNKLPLVATEATFLSLAGFSPVKVFLKRHIWVSSSVVSTPTKSPKSVHGFLDAKLVSKDNVKLFYVKFAFQVFLKAAFLVELTSFVHLATLKIAKSLVVSESGSLFAAVILHNVPLDVFTADIKTAFSVFGMITYVVLNPAGIWQYVVVHFENLVAAIFAFNY
ncbi:hypothetical protein G9A89_012634 [Geosiphon pyriformis]|nr:hypothetical protein G9A89_012634 [Geosiphon pyriformis]